MVAKSYARTHKERTADNAQVCEASGTLGDLVRYSYALKFTCSSAAMESYILIWCTLILAVLHEGKCHDQDDNLENQLKNPITFIQTQVLL